MITNLYAWLSVISCYRKYRFTKDNLYLVVTTRKFSSNFKFLSAEMRVFRWYKIKPWCMVIRFNTNFICVRNTVLLPLEPSLACLEILKVRSKLISYSDIFITLNTTALQWIVDKGRNNSFFLLRNSISKIFTKVIYCVIRHWKTHKTN